MLIEKLDVFPKTHEMYVVFNYGELNEQTNSCWFQYRNGNLNLVEDPDLFSFNDKALDFLSPEDQTELRRQVMAKLVEGYQSNQQFAKIAAKNSEKKFVAPLDPLPSSATMVTQENDDD